MQLKKNRVLEDVRYFESAEPPHNGQSFPSYAGKLYRVPPGSTALSQRIARRSGQCGVSIGHPCQLYLCLTASLSSGVIALSDRAAEPWHQIVLYGLDVEVFNALSDFEKTALLTRVTFDVLRALAPAMVAVLDEVQREIEEVGDAFRLTVRRKDTKKYRLTIEQTIPLHSQRAEIFLRAVQLASGAERVQKLGEALSSSLVPSLVHRMTIRGDILTCHPNQSFQAQMLCVSEQPLSTADLGTLFRS